MATILLAFEDLAVTFPGSKHEVGRCRETVAGGESKAARVSPGPRTLDPGPGTGTPSTADCSPRGPTPRLCAPLHRWETASPIAGNPPTFNLDRDDSPGTPSNGKGQSLAQSRPIPDSNAPVEVLGSLDLQQVASPLISPATRGIACIRRYSTNQFSAAELTQFQLAMVSHGREMQMLDIDNAIHLDLNSDTVEETVAVTVTLHPSPSPRPIPSHPLPSAFGWSVNNAKGPRTRNAR